MGHQVYSILLNPRLVQQVLTPLQILFRAGVHSTQKSIHCVQGPSLHSLRDTRRAVQTLGRPWETCPCGRCRRESAGVCRRAAAQVVRLTGQISLTDSNVHITTWPGTWVSVHPPKVPSC